MSARPVRGAPHGTVRSGAPGYVVRPVPAERRPVLDRLAGASRKPQVHALLEIDVAEARARILDAQPRVSWTGFVIATLARATAQHPEINARRSGNRIVYFDRVDIGATVEREDGRRTLDILVVRDADRKSCATISEELQLAKRGPGLAHPTSRLTAALMRLPGPLRRTGIRVVASRPRVAATFGPAVGVTSLGMFTSGWGWAIPLSPLTVVATVGGVVDRPVVDGGRVVARPVMPLTVTFDHGVVDGAPAARFVDTVRELAETAAVLDGALPMRPG